MNPSQQYDILDYANETSSTKLKFADMLRSQYLASCLCPCILLGQLAAARHHINADEDSIVNDYRSGCFECIKTFIFTITCYPLSPCLAYYVKDQRKPYEPFDHHNNSSRSTVPFINVLEKDIPIYLWPISLHNHYTFLMNPDNTVLFKLELEKSCSNEYLKTQENIPPKRIEKKIFVFGPPHSGKSTFVQKLVSDVHYRQQKKTEHLQHQQSSVHISKLPSSSSSSSSKMNNTNNLIGNQHTMDYDEEHQIADEMIASPTSITAAAAAVGNFTTANMNDDNFNSDNDFVCIPKPNQLGILDPLNDHREGEDDIKIGIKVLDMTHEAIEIIEVWDIPMKCSHSMFMNTFLSQAHALVFVFDASERSAEASLNKTLSIYENLIHNHGNSNSSNNNSNDNRGELLSTSLPSSDNINHNDRNIENHLNNTTKNSNNHSISSINADQVNKVMTGALQHKHIYLVAAKIDLLYHRTACPSSSSSSSSSSSYVSANNETTVSSGNNYNNNSNSSNNNNHNNNHNSSSSNSNNSSSNNVPSTNPNDTTTAATSAPTTLITTAITTTTTTTTYSVVENRRRVLNGAREWADNHDITYLEVSCHQNKGVLEARKHFMHDYY